jgi:ABC-type transporter Mla MlaB component
MRKRPKENARRARARGAGRASRRAVRAGSQLPLVLGASLTITEVRATGRSLAALLEAGRAEADGSALRAVDTAGLQLLLVAGRTARERGLKLRVTGAEELLLSTAAMLGLETHLTQVVELTP